MQATTALVDTRHAAAICGLSPRTLLGWRAAGVGPTYVRLGRAVRYPLADLLVFIDARRVRPATPANPGGGPRG